MHLLPIALLAVATTATAVPVETLFNLVTSGAPNIALNGLFVTTQSTGPLNSNAVLGTNTTASTFFMQNQTVHYVAPNGAPWEMALVMSQNVQAPVEVSVSPTTGSQGFVVGDDGRLAVEGQSWGGWLACGGPSQPSLDYINTGVGRSVPSGCDMVQLTALVKSTP